MSHSEQMIENQFIQILSEKENQWTYRPDLKSEEALWQNFRGHLNRINLAVLEEQLLTDKEFKGFSNSAMKKAAINVTENYKGLEILLTDPDRCLEVVSKQLSQATIPKEKMILASILGILGNNKGSSILTDTVHQHTDRGIYRTGETY